MSRCEDIELRIRFSLLLNCVHALKDHILVPYLTLLELSVLIELDLLFELPASFRRPYFVPNFLYRLHIAQTDFWHVIRRHGRQEAQVEHDEGDFVASGHLLELWVVALREGPAHFARHQGTHQLPIVVRKTIACQVDALHVLGIANAQDQVDQFLSAELVVGQIDVHEVWMALDQAAQLGRNHVVWGGESVQAQVEILQSLVEHEGVDDLFRNFTTQLALRHAQVLERFRGLEELGERFDGVEVESVRIQVQVEQVFAQSESIGQKADRDRLLDFRHDQLFQAVWVLLERRFEGFDEFSAHLDSCEVYVPQVRRVPQRASNEHGCSCIIQVAIFHHEFVELLNIR